MSDLNFIDNVDGAESPETRIVSDMGVVGTLQEENEPIPDLRSFDDHDEFQARATNNENNFTFQPLSLAQNKSLRDSAGNSVSRRIQIQAYLRGRFTHNDKASLSKNHHEHAADYANSTDDKDTIGLIFYRRNKFKVVGTVSIPREIAGMKLGNPSSSRITGLYAELDAVESLEGVTVRVIHADLKSKATTTPSRLEPRIDLGDAGRNSVPRTIQGLPRVCLWSAKDGNKGESGSESTGGDSVLSIPVFWDKLQFRHATAKKRGTWQYFFLRVTVIATLEDGTSHAISRSQSSAITVRGRSPQSFPTPASKTMKSGMTTGRGLQAVTGHQDGHRETEWSNSPVNFQPTDYNPTFGTLPDNLNFYDFSDLGIWNNDLQWQDENRKAEELSALNEYLDGGGSIRTSTNNTFLIPSSETHLLPNVPNLGSIFNLPESLSLSADYSNPTSSPGAPLSSFTSFATKDGLLGVGDAADVTSGSPEKLDGETAPFRKPDGMDGNESDGTDDERRTYSYEYIPLSINDWTVPVDAVYRPHGVHARKFPNVEKSVTKKRYFLSVS